VELLPRHSDLPGEFEAEAEAADEYFKERSREIQEAAAEHGIPIRCETRRRPCGQNLLRFADEGGYDLIVIGHSDHSELWAVCSATPPTASATTPLQRVDR